MKQLNCKKFSSLEVGGSSSLSVHLSSQAKRPPKNWSIIDLKRETHLLSYGLTSLMLQAAYEY